MAFAEVYRVSPLAIEIQTRLLETWCIDGSTKIVLRIIKYVIVVPLEYSPICRILCRYIY